MKKVIISFLVAAAALMPGSAKADNLTADQAKAAAAYYMRSISNTENLTANDMILVGKIDNVDLGIPAAYFFNASKDGWIILAASSVINPIIACSPTGTLDADNLPTNMQIFLDNYISQVSNIQKRDIEQDLPDSPEWNLISNNIPYTNNESIILTNQCWGYRGFLQNIDIYRYNDQRAIDNMLIITTLAHICHYYQYPIQPQGRYNNGYVSIIYNSISFNYNLMPNELDGASYEEIREVSKLYESIGLGVLSFYPFTQLHQKKLYSFGFNIFEFMNFHFKYNRGHVVNSGDVGRGWFVNTIRQELLKKNIIYMIDSRFGSGWLCAGYLIGDTNMYFMNWGNNGIGNGFFNLMIPGQQYININNEYRYSDDLAIVLGMTPPDDSNRFLVDIHEVDNTTISPAYPNPATISVTIPYSIDVATELYIYSIDGRVVTKINVPAGNGETSIDVVNLPAGIYIYRLNNISGKFVVK